MPDPPGSTLRRFPVSCGRAGRGELWDLHEPRLDRVVQAEAAHNPGEGPVRVLPDATHQAPSLPLLGSPLPVVRYPG
jgi:hypothetical protein